MPNGYSLHIGLNHVDPAAYKGWEGKLRGCLNDAAAMKAICDRQGFTSSSLLDENATSSAVLAAIAALASNARSGNTVVISFSGHGGQVPDTTGTEDDGMCETWLCFDRMVVDKELYGLWSKFARNVHVEVYSDSCHSGTVVRELIIPNNGATPWAAQASTAAKAVYSAPSKASALAKSYPGAKTGTAPPASVGTAYKVARNAVPRSQAAYTAVFAPALQFAITREPKTSYERMIPSWLAFQLFSEQPQLQRQAKAGPIQCGLVLISGCQDNQTSSDGAVNGLFTETLLKVWDSGNFQGTIPQLHRAIVALMPADQTPNYDLVGLDDDVISNGRPLTILDGSAASMNIPVMNAMQGSVERTDAAPSFVVAFGAGRNGIVEVTTDKACFDDSTLRSVDNFYATWSDSARLTDGAWSIPKPVWSRMNGASALYYRAGSTPSMTGWDDYLLSSSSSDAPSIQITANAAMNGGAPDTKDPRVEGPAAWPRASQDPPHFTVATDAPYYIVEMATDSRLFADENSRTADNFYATWQDEVGRLTTPDFTLRDDAWARLRASQRLYYRVGTTTSSDAWNDYHVSTEDADATNAPSVAIE